MTKAGRQEARLDRVQVTSSAKRRRRPGSNALAQTPDGSFRDLMANARDLLLNHCGFTSVPEVRRAFCESGQTDAWVVDALLAR